MQNQNTITRPQSPAKRLFPRGLALLALLAITSTTLGRNPPPSAADRAKTLDLIKTLFKTDYAKAAPADRRALAQRLFDEARATHDDPVGRYVLLDQVTDLASNAGAAPLALQAIDLQALDTLVEPLPAKVLALQRAQLSAGIGNPAGQEAIVHAALPLLEQTLAADDFTHARALLLIAQAAASTAQKVDLAQQVARQDEDVQSLQAEYTQVQAAQEKLQTTPDDPALNLTLGHYYGLSKGQWDCALNYLAKSSDPALKTLAEKEIATPLNPLKPDGLAQLQLADAWWDLATAKSLRGRAKTNVLSHARQWYQAASITISGLTLTRIRERLQTPAPGGTTSRPAGIPVPGAVALDLLALADPIRDRGTGAESPGTWQLHAGKLLCGKARHARLQLPYLPPEEYDLHITFSRQIGDGPIVILLTGLGQTFNLSVDAQGHVARFEAVAKKLKKDNPTTVPCTLATEQTYTLTVQVRKETVTALLNGKKLCDFTGDPKLLSRPSGWKLPESKTLGLGAANSEVLFGPIRLFEITGHGNNLR